MAWVESKDAGFFIFSHIRMMGYFMLGNLVTEYPTGLENWACRVRASCRARNSYCENTKKSTSFDYQTTIFICIRIISSGLYNYELL